MKLKHSYEQDYAAFNMSFFFFWGGGVCGLEGGGGENINLYEEDLNKIPMWVNSLFYHFWIVGERKDQIELVIQQ